MLKLVNGEAKRVDEPALTALNMRLRDDYTQDCVKGMLRWNKIISTAGYDYKLTLPNVAFHRQIGEFKDVHATPDGVLIDDATWAKRKYEWLPSTEDGDFIASLMTPVSEVGKVCLVDRAAQGRHRQQARRLRVREDRVVVIPGASEAPVARMRSAMGASPESITTKRGVGSDGAQNETALALDFAPRFIAGHGITRHEHRKPNPPRPTSATARCGAHGTRAKTFAPRIRSCCRRSGAPCGWSD